MTEKLLTGIIKHQNKQTKYEDGTEDINCNDRKDRCKKNLKASKNQRFNSKSHMHTVKPV